MRFHQSSPVIVNGPVLQTLSLNVKAVMVLPRTHAVHHAQPSVLEVQRTKFDGNIPVSKSEAAAILDYTHQRNTLIDKLLS